jgi:hypothetical protein
MDRIVSRKLPDWANENSVGGMTFDKGVYSGIVKQNVDPLRLGRLRVWFPDKGGNEEDANNWRWVNYASPYYGTTMQSEKNNKNSYDQARSTYGMWMVPPDVGVTVLCIFVNGDASRGFWFSVVTSSNLSHGMIPAIGRFTDNIDKENVQSDLVKASLGRPETSYLPLAEFNENISTNMSAGFLTNKFPIHEPQAEILINQGLDTDNVRGAISSSSMRDAPGKVFGISTPGVAADTGSNITPKVRKGGHTFVMDDGDSAGTDKLIRLRTSGGHQILMNDSEQVLYISNSAGSVWMEFGNSGALHVYSSQGMNFRTQGTMNLHSDASVNIQGSSVNIRSLGSMQLQSSTMRLRASSDLTMYSASVGLGSSGKLSVTAGGELGVKAGAELKLVGSYIRLNDGAVNTVSDPGEMQTNNHADANKNGAGLWSAVAGTLDSIATVAPTHEPWLRNSTPVPADAVYNSAVQNVCTDLAPTPQLPTGSAGGAGPLGDYIAGFESGSASYNAFNRGSSPPKGTGSVGGEKMSLVDMTIDQILTAMSSSDPYARLFAVGRYQCIPDTLQAACKKLSIPTSSKFSSDVQDRIFVEFLSTQGSMGAYLKGGDANDTAALINACSSCAGVWASIEDPKLGRGRYDGVGTNNAHGKTAGTTAAFKAQYAFLRQGAVQSGSGTVITDGSGNAIKSGGTNLDSGIKAAAGQSVTKQAPAEYMKRADTPTPNFELPARGGPDDGNYQPGLTTPQVKALMVQIAYAESDWNPGFKTASTLGRYGVNGVLLAEYGFIKPDYLKKYKADCIGQIGAWTGKEGVNSAADFLQSTGAQDICMTEFIQDTFKRLTTSRGIDFKDSICAAAGMIYVSYFFKEQTQLFGSDVNAMILAAKTWRTDNIGTNSSKQTPIDSYNRGRYAIDVLSVAGNAAGGGSGVGSATAPSDTGINPDDIFIWGENATRSQFEQETTAFKNAILAAGQEYVQKSGKKIKLASAYRSQEDQDRLYNTWIKAGGGPGVPTAGGITTPAKQVGSHGGAAIDAGSQAAEIASIVNLAQYGLRWGGTFSTPDKVHIQLASFVPGQKV